MARGGMADLITQLRAKTAAGTADYSVAGVTYWTDDQLQTMLDAERSAFYREALRAESLYDAGTVRFYDYFFPRQHVEGSASGTAGWRVEDGSGNTISISAYTVNMDAQQIVFSSDTQGSAYYLSGRSYDLERAAAAVWEQKAADVADRFDLQTDNHTLSRSQLYKHYMDMAKRYRSAAKPRTVRMVRTDANF
jgi:hypothetical protein